MQKPKVFMIIKPECSIYVNLVVSVLNEHDLTISDVFFISDWLPIARKVYEHRIASEPAAFHSGFEGHLWLSSYLFGRAALAITLRSKSDDETDLLSIAKRADIAKASFRNCLPHTRDGRILMLMNSKEIDELSLLIEGTMPGMIGVQQSNKSFIKIETSSEGLWDYYYLKYIHVPSPDLSEIWYEWNALIDMGVITQTNRLSPSDWKLVQRTRSIAVSQIRGFHQDN